MPVVTPVTTPDVPSTVELPLLLVHAPPGSVLASVVVCPAHTDAVPVIAPGFGLTVTSAVRAQPVAVMV